MLVDTFLYKEFQVEAENESCVYDAQAFQTRNNYNLGSQGKEPLIEPPPPKGRFVPLDATQVIIHPLLKIFKEHILDKAKAKNML